jgi:type IV pilus assembly protein PilC
MPKYSYIAKSLKGEEKSEVVEAKNVRELAKTLKQQGFILVKAEAAAEEDKKRKLKISLPFLERVSLEDKMMFTRNLQVMVASGLPLPRALQTLAEQAKNKKLKNALSDIREKIVKGKNFSEALKDYPDIFPELFQNMIKVGEESGTLEKVLEVLSRQMEREHELKAKVKGALMYPAVIILAMVGIGILMLIVVVPELGRTFEELGIELPVTTRLVIGIGTFMAERWYLAIVILIVLVFLLWTASKTKLGKKIIDTFMLKLPVISALIKKTNSAYTVRTLSSLIASGIPIVRSLEIVAGVLGNIYYKEAIMEAAEKVKKGGKLSEALKAHKDIYPLVVFQMIEVGEETGESSEILARLADFFEEEVGNATKNLASVIEPVLMIIIGAAIGFFAISMVQPMYSMLGAL